MPDYVILITPSAEESAQIKSWLLPEGIEVRALNSLGEALEDLAATPAAVILFDTDNPEDWREALDELLAVEPAARVVLLSRLADERMWVEVLGRGGYDLLLKALLETEVRAVVHNALDPVPLQPVAA